MHKLPSKTVGPWAVRSTGPVSCRRPEAYALGRRRLSIGGAGTHGAVGPVGVQWSDGGAVKVLVGRFAPWVSPWKVGPPLPSLGSTLWLARMRREYFHRIGTRTSAQITAWHVGPGGCINLSKTVSRLNSLAGTHETEMTVGCRSSTSLSRPRG